MSDADLAAVELRVGTIAANGAADHSEPSSQQSEGSPLANGATDPLFIPGDKKTGPQVKLPFGSAAVPPWLSHWRLKLALSSASQYQVRPVVSTHVRAAVRLQPCSSKFRGCHGVLPGSKWHIMGVSLDMQA